ncbi:MAG TPA: hypothetical protein VFW65_36470 [Pseudonocardiaceae bacterium]|nr:hypothetical protein [Pseudonocardiaceae bacterium]
MVGVVWSRCAGRDCVRFSGPVAHPQVRPSSAAVSAPAMAGTLVDDGGDVCFVPRFGFVAGTEYTVTSAGTVLATLTRPARAVSPIAAVAAIHPTVDVVPRNLLRCYVTFTAPMAEGDAATRVRLVDDAGTVLDDALLPTEYELWSTDHTRLTVLLDPARIKRGLAGHRAAGYPLRTGERVRLVVDTGFRDATGAPLAAGGERTYHVGDDLRGHVDPATWHLTPPAAGTREPLAVAFGRPLDSALLGRCLRVVGPAGPVAGAAVAGDGERAWRLTPALPWQPGPHRLLVDPVLEDVAGNAVGRVFDRDLADPADGPVTTGFAEVTFAPTT